MTWATSVPVLVFIGLSVLNLGRMYATDRQTDVRRASSLNAPILGAGHNNLQRNVDRSTRASVPSGASGVDMS